MGSRSEVWLLAKRELRWNGLKYLFAIPAAAYLAFVTGMLMKQLRGPNEMDPFFGHWLLDFFFLFGVGALSTASMKEGTFKALRSRTPSKRLALLRQLPIEPSSIVKSKALVMIINLAIMCPVFYITLHLSSTEVRRLMSGAEFVAFALTWAGYMLLFGALFFYWVMVFREKIYILCTVLGWIVTLTLPLLIAWAFGYHLVEGSIEGVKRYGFLLPIVSLLIGSVVLIEASRRASRLLAVRDFDR